MVFYIEACESGSMMNHLSDDINGKQSVLFFFNMAGTASYKCAMLQMDWKTERYCQSVIY